MQQDINDEKPAIVATKILETTAYYILPILYVLFIVVYVYVFMF